MTKQLLKNYHILLIDDDRSLCEVVEFSLKERGYQVDTASTGEQGLALFKKRDYQLVVTDMKMPGMDGIQVLKELRCLRPQIMVIMITAFGSVEMAVEAMKLGAYDYITKPINLEEFNLTIKNALERYRLVEENKRLKSELGEKFSRENIITVSNNMLDVLDMVEKVADSEATVLIQGESGTGKELLAKALHYQSERGQAPFITINCAAIPKELLESELFGHKKGAFTGAHRDRKGKFELADRGSIFLDEIGELPLELQTKLLRALEEKQIDAVGAEVPTQVDVRIIAATNQDLERLTEQGRFREDLFYRINVIPVHIPPLRERPEDIPVLFKHFLHKFAPDGKISCSSALLAELKRYPWKGNVRELENLCRRLLLLRKSNKLDIDDLPRQLSKQPLSEKHVQIDLPSDSMPLEELQNQVILKALERHNWNQTKTADYLKIPRHVLLYRLEKFGLKKHKPGKPG